MATRTLKSLARRPHALRTQVDDGSQVALAQLVGREDLALGGLQFVLRIGHVDLHDLRGVHQAPGVVREPEYGWAGRGVIGTHAFEHADAVVQRVGQDVYPGIAPGNKLAVLPDPTVAVVEGVLGHVLPPLEVARA